MTAVTLEVVYIRFAKPDFYPVPGIADKHLDARTVQAVDLVTHKHVLAIQGRTDFSSPGKAGCIAMPVLRPCLEARHVRRNRSVGVTNGRASQIAWKLVKFS